ncbi:MAG: hypothetical protein AAF492_28130, partial [Verrucomicrobiota bacterium]
AYGLRERWIGKPENEAAPGAAAGFVLGAAIEEPLNREKDEESKPEPPPKPADTPVVETNTEQKTPPAPRPKPLPFEAYRTVYNAPFTRIRKIEQDANVGRGTKPPAEQWRLPRLDELKALHQAGRLEEIAEAEGLDTFWSRDFKSPSQYYVLSKAGDTFPLQTTKTAGVILVMGP